jgi:hypothetical protein
MMRIQFDKLGGNWKVLVLMGISAICLLFSIFELIEFDNPLWKKGLSFVAFAIPVILGTRMFWYKNYVRWNNKGMYVKINSLFGNTFNFEDVKSSTLKENVLSINKFSEKVVIIDLGLVIERDCARLFEIIEEHTRVPSI